MAHILSLVPLIGLGVAVSLAVFLFFEKRAIQAKKQHEKSHDINAQGSLTESFALYETEKNVISYMGVMFIFTLFLSYMAFFKGGLTLADVFLYIFLTTFVGSVIILVLKLKRNILIKVFAAFLYGAPLIATSAFGFILSYLFYSFTN